MEVGMREMIFTINAYHFFIFQEDTPASSTNPWEKQTKKVA
jgi:hypothetical protein